MLSLLAATDPVPDVWTKALIVTAALGVLTVMGVLVTGAITYFNSKKTTAQKSENDKREAWWERSQWAMERCYDSDPVARAIGITVMGRLRLSELATAEDRAMMAEVALVVLTGGSRP